MLKISGLLLAAAVSQAAIADDFWVEAHFNTGRRARAGINRADGSLEFRDDDALLHIPQWRVNFPVDTVMERDPLPFLRRIYGEKSLILKIPTSKYGYSLGKVSLEDKPEIMVDWEDSLSIVNAKVWVNYLERTVNEEGRVVTVMQRKQFPWHELSIYDGSNLHPREFATTDFLVEGEFKEPVQLLPLTLIGEDFLCVATRDFRLLRQGYTKRIRYLLVPVTLLKFARTQEVRPSDGEDRVLRTYILYADDIPAEGDLMTNVKSASLKGLPIPDFEMFAKYFNAEFTKTPRPSKPKANWIQTCVGWIVGRIP